MGNDAKTAMGAQPSLYHPPPSGLSPDDLREMRTAIAWPIHQQARLVENDASDALHDTIRDLKV